MRLQSDHGVRTLSHLEFFARQAVEGFITGMHKSPYHGFSVEFAEHRLYNVGESTRHIDWKLYARTEKLFIKRYEEETNLRCRIMLDVSGSMYFPTEPAVPGAMNKLSFAIHAAAALIELFRRQRDAVGLSIFDQNLRLQTAAGSSAVHMRYLYHEMEQLLSAPRPIGPGRTSVAEALHTAAESLPRRSLVIIFSDMLDNTEKSEKVFTALQHLRHAKHEVVLFHLNDAAREIRFEYDNRPYTFVDLETGEELKLNPGAVKVHYQKRMTEFLSNMKHRCSQYRIDFADADISRGFHFILLQYLIKRQKMF